MKKLLIASLVSSLLVGCGSGGGSTETAKPAKQTDSLTIEQQQEIIQAIKDSDETLAQAQKAIDEGNALLEAYKPEPNTDHLITAEELPDGGLNLVVTSIPFDVCKRDTFVTEDWSDKDSSESRIVTGYWKIDYDGNSTFISYSCNDKPSNIYITYENGLKRTLKEWKKDNKYYYRGDEKPSSYYEMENDDGSKLVNLDWFNSKVEFQELHYRENDLPSEIQKIVYSDETEKVLSKIWYENFTDSSGYTSSLPSRGNALPSSINYSVSMGTQETEYKWENEGETIKSTRFYIQSGGFTIKDVFYDKDQNKNDMNLNTEDLLIQCEVDSIDILCEGEAESDALHLLPYYIK